MLQDFKYHDDAFGNKPSVPVDILKLETLQDYRFATMVKSENYAFARGLTISPVHLPAALEAMRSDGWHLLSVFGETTSDKIGFLFEKRNFS